MRKTFPGLRILNACKCTEGLYRPLPFPPLRLKNAMEFKETMILLVFLKSLTWSISQQRAKIHCLWSPGWLPKSSWLAEQSCPAPLPKSLARGLTQDWKKFHILAGGSSLQDSLQEFYFLIPSDSFGVRWAVFYEGSLQVEREHREIYPGLQLWPRGAADSPQHQPLLTVSGIRRMQEDFGGGFY